MTTTAIERKLCSICEERFVPPARAINPNPICNHCTLERGRSKRERLWATGQVRCVYHPAKVCNRAEYISQGKRYCSACCARNSDGKLRTSKARQRQEWNKKRAVRRSKKGHVIDLGFSYKTLRNCDRIGELSPTVSTTDQP